MPTSTATNTPVDPTATPTSTATATATFTPLPPTNTPTATATATNTLAPLPPADTPTPTATATTPQVPTATNTPAAGLILTSGFEDGSFSAWSASVVDGGDLSVAHGAALEGAYGMQAVINGTAPLYVRDDLPLAEPHYQASFWFDPNSITMANQDHHYLFLGYSPVNRVIMRIEFQFINGQYRVRFTAANDNNVWSNGSWATLSDGPHRLQLDFLAASAAGANNGTLTFWIDGVQVSLMTGIDNDAQRIEQVRLGPSTGIDAGTNGTYFFDSFESYR
jgi:hypothetical protein